MPMASTKKDGISGPNRQVVILAIVSFFASVAQFFQNHSLFAMYLSHVQMLNKEVIEEPVPAITVESKLTVSCSRGFYCETDVCMPIYIRKPSYTSHSYQEIQSFLIGNESITATPTSPLSYPVRIQYWGDSIQATMECDMRQWLHEIDLLSPPIDVVRWASSFLVAGCPWHCNPPEDYWENLINSTRKHDVIVFNLGSHYEQSYPNDLGYSIGNTSVSDDIESVFRAEIFQRYFDILQSFVSLERKILLVRGPSPTHFDTHDGLANTTQRQTLLQWYQENATYEYCTAFQKTPDIVKAQEDILHELVDRLQSSNTTSPSSRVAYIDVYDISKGRHSEHTTIPKEPLDCKHFCQNCGLLRAWNSLVMDYLMSI